MVNKRTPTTRPPGRRISRLPAPGTGPRRRSQADRRQQTRQALLDAALGQMEAGIGFEALSLRRVARAAGIVPAAFYRHFAGMDELGLALVEDSVLALRSMLREAREDGPAPERVIERSVKILFAHVREHRRHFAFVAQARASGNAVLRHAIRSETKLFASELATDLARFPVLREWSTSDLQMLAGMFVETMISAIEAFLEASPGGGVQPPTPEAEARIAKQTERQLRFLALAIPQWRSRP